MRAAGLAGSSPPEHPRDMIQRLALCLPVLLLGACLQTTDDATMTVALTDAASDDLASFVVEITGVELTRPSGVTVGVLPAPVTVDLVSLTDVSQVLNVANLPAGFYTLARLTFDFTDAEAYLVGRTTPATLLDGDGNPLTGTVTLPISTGGSIEAITGRNRLLELDFDLDQSVLVDLGTNTLRMEPKIVLRLDPLAPRDLLFGGALQEVDTTEGTIALELQTPGEAPIGDLVVPAHPAAVYQIDGVPSSGSTGLAALAAETAGTWIQCFGRIDPSSGTLRALYVEAGTGTYNGGSDIVDGLVIERIGGAGSDATLTVLGHSNDATHTVFQFNETFTVNTSFAATQVLRRGAVTAQDMDDVNVGQAVRLFGSLSATTLNATAGVVRLRPTRVLGFCNGPVSTGSLTIDLARVELRDPSGFTWSDGGPTPPSPSAFTNSVGSLANGLGLMAGTAVELHGYFAPVDDSAQDFQAVTVINRDTAPSLLLVNDLPGGQNLSVIATTAAITLGVTGTPVPFEVAVIDRGFVGSTALPSSPAPTVTPAGALGIYLIFDRVTGVGSLNLTFTEHVTTLNTLLGVGAHVRSIAAIGQYDAGTNATSAGLVVITLD